MVSFTSEAINVGLRTALYDWHCQHGGKIVDFGGWDMPIQYTSIVEEHRCTRNAAGLFDISHMGRLWFSGPHAAALLDRLLSNRVDNLRDGQVRYALVLNEQGGTKDDVLVYRLADQFLLVVNASNREKIWAWIERHRSADTAIEDRTLTTAMIACQGPRGVALAEEVLGLDCGKLGYYRAMPATLADGAPCLVSRTGYTGEDGVELIVAADRAVDIWQRLAERGALPIGLGARDTLRTEAGMPLYGHELDENIDPVQAGLGWAAKPKAAPFIGQEALAALPPDRPVRVGLELSDRRIARAGCTLVSAGNPVGTVTSGTFAPTLEKSIAMGMVAPACAAVGQTLEAIVRDRPVPAKIVPLPFYRRG